MCLQLLLTSQSTKKTLKGSTKRNVKNWFEMNST